MKISTRHIVFMGLLICLNVLLTRMASINVNFGGTVVMRIGFGAFPLIFAGILFGAKRGAIVGLIGDLIGYNINPTGLFMPHFTAIAAMTGVIPGILFQLLRFKVTFINLVIINGITLIIVSAMLTPYALKVLFGIPFAITIPGRVLSILINVPLYAYVMQILYNRLMLINNGVPNFRYRN